MLHLYLIFGSHVGNVNRSKNVIVICDQIFNLIKGCQMCVFRNFRCALLLLQSEMALPATTLNTRQEPLPHTSATHASRCLVCPLYELYVRGSAYTGVNMRVCACMSAIVRGCIGVWEGREGKWG